MSEKYNDHESHEWTNGTNSKLEKHSWSSFIRVIRDKKMESATAELKMRTEFPKVRATAVLIEDRHILLVEQRVTESLARQWSLPGGTLEFGETLQDCIIREMREETGLDVTIDRLLYVCDRLQDDHHVTHVTFAVNRIGGRLQLGTEPETGANPIKSVEMVPLTSLRECGFSERFCELALAGFPGSGSYQGSVTNIGL